jgi:hypothetical protein
MDSLHRFSQSPPGYVFGRGARPSFQSLYNFHHTQRFRWLRKKVASAGKSRAAILELGCNDATSLGYVPVPVYRYLGFDAGWGSGWKNGVPRGLEAARLRYQGIENIEFRKSQDVRDVAGVPESFDFVFVLETFEYLQPIQLESYISALAGKVRPDGCIISTMPNEKGFSLLLKHVGSHLSGIPRSRYTVGEFLDALLGRMDRVPRAERSRKGFDYECIFRIIRRHFRCVRLEPVGAPFLPRSLSLNIGLVASHEPLPFQARVSQPAEIAASGV